jgi:hypothetical protein
MDNASQQQQRRRRRPSKEEEEEYVRNMMQRRARGRVIDAILARGTIERSGSLSLQAERSAMNLVTNDDVRRRPL